MKKIFTLAAALLATVAMMAGNITIPLDSMTAGTNSYAYNGTEIKAKSNNVYIALPSASIKGSITIFGSSNKSDRYLYIYAEAGTVKDVDRPIQMKSDGVTIDFTSSDIVTVSEVPCLLFSTSDDFKFKKFNYSYEPDKQIDSKVETLIGAAINKVALDASDLNELISSKSVNLLDEYVTAPTVTFTKKVVTTYDDQSTKTDTVDVDVVAALNPDGKWQAQQTVGEQTYSITAVKPATVTITYMDGATVLGEEIVKVGESATKHGEYEVKPLAEFQGWYTDAELTSKADLSVQTFSANTTIYGKFTKAYAQSLNIEQLVVTNGKSYGIKDALTAAGYEYSNLDALDSLNNEKGAARNEPYLGLKIKKQGGFIACNVATGSTIRVKFGYVENDVLAIAGNDTMTLTPANKTLDVLEFTATADTYVKIQTTSGKTVVIKQIMVNEAITDVMYKITYEAAENGKVEGWTIAFPHEKVNLTVTPDSAYHVVSVTAGNEVLLPDTASNYSFEMPGQATTVSATFAADEPVVPTLYTVTLGTYEHGAVAFIEPNEDNKYAEGAEVRLSVTPDEGFEVEAISLEGIDLAIPVVDGVASFNMPAQDVTVLATFKAAAPQPTLYTVTLGTYEHGSVAFIEPNEGNKYAENAEVRLSVTPDEGFEVEAISLEGIDLAIPVVDGVASFNMPAQDVTVLATFKAKEEGFENIDASTKAVKFIEDGQLYILKNGVKYNTQGAVVNQ